MDKATIEECLQTLATNNQRRSKAARLRDVLDLVEMTLAAGVRRTDVLAALEAHGLHMSLSTFETTLKRLRAKRRREPLPLHAPQRCEAIPPALVVATISIPNHVRPEPQPSHDPADLDRIIATRPDLTALARLAKRSRK